MMTQDAISSTPGACFAYYGDRGDWPIVATQHRDSDLIERCNFAVAERMLRAAGEQTDATGEYDGVAIERASHWAVGWIERLLIAPGNVELARIAAEIHDALEQYPILNDGAYSDMETQEHIDGVCEEHCSECEYERSSESDHERGQCDRDCRFCEADDGDDDGRYVHCAKGEHNRCSERTVRYGECCACECHND
jgi:hypothetical protein